MRKKSKGISPLVAVIMLIAFTMIVAGILAGWATRFATEQRSILEKCVRANIVIKRATCANDNISIMLYNAGTVPLKGFQVQATYNNETLMPTTWSKPDDSVAANSFETFTYNLSSSVVNDVNFVEIRSMECQGAYDMIRSYDITGLSAC
jgi:flagellin-like protein